MSRKSFLQSSKRGSILALMVIVIVLLSVMGVGMLQCGLQARVFAARTANEIAAQTAADAGMTKALYTMNKKLEAGWDDGPLPWPSGVTLANCEASFSYKVAQAAAYLDAPIGSVTAGEYDEGIAEYVLSAMPAPGDYVVKSVGICKGAEKAVYGILRLRGLGEYGVLVRDLIILKSGTLVDGFNSSDPTDTDVPIEIGTVSTSSDRVVLNNGVIVDGNILVGVGGNPNLVIKDLGAQTGLRYPMPEEPDFPVITVPTLPQMGSIGVHGSIILIGPEYSGIYSEITLKRGTEPAILQVTGGDVVLYVTGNIKMGQGCEIKISEGSTLSLYIEGDIRADEDSGFNNEGVPPDLKIWGTASAKSGQDLQLKAKSEYFGQIYAPNAAVRVMAKTNLYGAFTAKSFEMKSGGNLFYDGALRDVEPDNEGVRFVLERWCE